MTNIKERIQYRRENSVDPEEFLLDAGIVRPTDDGEDLQLTPEFASALQESVADIESQGVTVEDVATLWDVDMDDIEHQNESYPSYKIINTIRNWPTDAALTIDIAVDRILRERQDDWDDVPPLQRYRIAQVLRTFQDECLFCGGEILYSNEPVESCCLDTHVLTFSCDDCGRRFMEFATDDQNMADSVQA